VLTRKTRKDTHISWLHLAAANVKLQLVRAAISTQSYGNFGLGGGDGKDRVDEGKPPF